MDRRDGLVIVFEFVIVGVGLVVVLGWVGECGLVGVREVLMGEVVRDEVVDERGKGRGVIVVGGGLEGSRDDVVGGGWECGE